MAEANILWCGDEADASSLRGPSVNSATFARSLKTHLFTIVTSTLSVLEVLLRNALDKLTYLLTCSLVHVCKAKSLLVVYWQYLIVN